MNRALIALGEQPEVKPSFVLVEFIADQVGAFYKRLKEHGIVGIQALDMAHDLEQELVRLAAPQLMQHPIPRVTETRSEVDANEIAQQVKQQIGELDRLRMSYG